MVTFSNYIDQYGYNGWRDAGGRPALLMMVRDEIQTPGSTDLSRVSRAFLTQLDTSSTYTLSNGSQVLKLFYGIRAGAPADTTNYGQLSAEAGNTAFDTYMKQYSEVRFQHGGVNDPFTTYTDTISSTGSLITDFAGTVNVQLVSDSYSGALSSKALGLEFIGRSAIVTSNEIFSTMLARAIENGVATAAQVQADFGTYAPSVVNTAISSNAGENSNITLPRLAALDDPMSTYAFKAYLAYFGRPPDTGGLTNWVATLNSSNNTMDTLIEYFGNSAESNALYSSASSDARVTAIFQYLFNRAPRQEGLDFWSDAIDNGQMTMAGAALNIINGARNDAVAGLYDLTMVNAKVGAARAFVAALDTQGEINQYVGSGAALNARKYLSTITADASHNTQVVQLVGQVIGALDTGVDTLFSQHGISLGYF